MALRAEPKVAALDVLGPSDRPDAIPDKAREVDFFAPCPRRKAFAEGGGRGSTCSIMAGGDELFFGGVIEREPEGVNFSAGGGEISARKSGVALPY